MTATTKLALELLQNNAANQTLANTTFAQLNQLVQAGVVDKDLATPPGSPANEALYIPAAGATGAWSGKAGQLAYWLTSTAAWQFIVPRAGFAVRMLDELDGAGLPKVYGHTGSAWVEQPSAAFTGGTLTGALNEAPIVTIASAATVNIGAATANTVSISGTVTITAFDTIASGALRRLHFQAALTLTHNGTSLILPTAANITTAAGDVAEFVSLGAGNWRCLNYQRANGDSVAFAFDRENILGTVSQSAGVPTGAIIERGSNANGEYVRYADGTQICTNNSFGFSDRTTGAGSLFKTADLLWTFPAVFSTPPVCAGKPRTGAPSVNAWYGLGTGGDGGLTQMAFAIHGASSVSGAGTAMLQAIGRWF